MRRILTIQLLCYAIVFAIMFSGIHGGVNAINFDNDNEDNGDIFDAIQDEEHVPPPVVERVHHEPPPAEPKIEHNQQRSAVTSSKPAVGANAVLPKGELYHVSADTWNQHVISERQCVVVFFYQPGNKFSDIWESEVISAARVLKDETKFVAMDGADPVNREIAVIKYRSSHFPRLLLFGVDKEHPHPYEGAKNNATIVNNVRNFIKSQGMGAGTGAHAEL